MGVRVGVGDDERVFGCVWGMMRGYLGVCGG